MDKEQFTWLADPGHAWLVVPYDLVKDLGIVDKITEFSFHDHLTVVEQGRQKVVHFAFLEEDYDAGVFAKAMKDAGREWEADDDYVERFDRTLMRRFGHSRSEHGG